MPELLPCAPGPAPRPRPRPYTPAPPHRALAPPPAPRPRPPAPRSWPRPCPAPAAPAPPPAPRPRPTATRARPLHPGPARARPTVAPAPPPAAPAPAPTTPLDPRRRPRLTLHARVLAHQQGGPLQRGGGGFRAGHDHVQDTGHHVGLGKQALGVFPLQKWAGPRSAGGRLHGTPKKPAPAPRQSSKTGACYVAGSRGLAAAPRLR